MSVLSLNKIEKRYGSVHALKGLDLNVGEGDVYGFLGRNGAGKSTALQVIMGITRANSGELSLFDTVVKGDIPSIRQKIGYVAQEQHFYGWMTAKQLGKFVSGFYPDWDDQEFQRLSTLLEIPGKQKVLGFSGGMRAKLALCLALAHRPELLLLDEPTAGMDAVARREFIEIIRDQAVRSQRTTLFSSHLIDEVEQAADKVGIIDQGAMLYEGSLEKLQHSVIRFCINLEDGEGPAFPEEIATQGLVLRDQQQHGKREVTIQFPVEYQENILPPLWVKEQPSLEDIFVSMVSKTVSL